MTTASSEWMTVADAARTLGLSDRHARRLADRLSDDDRLKQGTSPLRVRLAALSLLWEREAQSDSRTQSAAESDTMADTAHWEEAVSRARLEERLESAEAMVVELRDDKQRLQETLQREQENHHRLLDQLSDERRDLRLMQARPLPALPSMPEHSEADDEDAPAPSPPPLPTVPAPEQPPPSFWQRLAHWVSD